MTDIIVNIKNAYFGSEHPAVDHVLLRTSDFTGGAVAETNAPRFELTADGDAVLDHKTGLVWARDELPRQDYASAEKAVAALSVGGLSDWRLPTREELESILDLSRHEPAIDTAFFNSAASWVWTSTPVAWSSDHVWIVGFGHGNVSGDHRNYSALARAVRAAAPAGQ